MIDAILMVFTIGVLTRIADMTGDEGLNLNRYARYMVGVAYGFLTAHVIASHPLLAPIGLAVMLSVLLAGKIDSRIHLMGLGSFLFFTAVYGLGPVDLTLMLIFIAGAALDETGNSLSDTGKLRGPAGRFFRYRLTLEVTTFLVGAFTGVWLFFLAILSYDTGFTYVFPERVRKKLISLSG